MRSYLNKTFVIDDPEARIREDQDLLSYVMENGKPKLIPIGTAIKVTDAKLLKDSVFVYADGWGWTAGDNLKNNFLNETLAAFPPVDNDQKGPNAAWDKGQFLKQLTLIQIVGADNSVKYISADIAQFYLDLVNHAESDGVPVRGIQSAVARIQLSVALSLSSGYALPNRQPSPDAVSTAAR